MSPEAHGRQLPEDWLVEDAPTPVAQAQPAWRIMVVDDEADVHLATSLALSGASFRQRPIQIISAYSAAEARELLAQTPDLALILLDVVLESEHAGLDLARYVREALGNHCVRIVLRTGQPGQAPERDVILNYDINDYKNKSELTANKLFTTTIAALRAYENLRSLVHARAGLLNLLTHISPWSQPASMRELAAGLFTQMAAMIHGGLQGALCVQGSPNHGAWRVVAHFGLHATSWGLPALSTPDLPSTHALHAWFDAARASGQNLHHASFDILYFPQPQHPLLIAISPAQPLAPADQQLLALFCQRMSRILACLSAWEDEPERLPQGG